MRRLCFSWFIVASGCLAFTLNASAVLGRDDLRTSMFRELTSEQPSERSTHDTSAASARRTNSEAFLNAETPPAPPKIRPATFSGVNSTQQVTGQFPRRAAIQPNPRPTMRRYSKPFETAEHEPTISPYLNLDRDDSDAQDIPNYLTMVLPQLEQMQMNRNQQREIHQLRGQLQSMSSNAGALPAHGVNRSAGIGSSARFMDTAQFYNGLR
jgi:hypothetical protein